MGIQLLYTATCQRASNRRVEIYRQVQQGGFPRRNKVISGYRVAFSQLGKKIANSGWLPQCEVRQYELRLGSHEVQNPPASGQKRSCIILPKENCRNEDS